MAVTIPSGWTTASSCMTSGDVWHWNNGATDFDALGSPAETSVCYPPDYTPTLGFVYTADSCPHGFTPACTTDYYSTSWTTICCPSGHYSFSCGFVSFSSLTLGCSSSYTALTTITITGVSVADETTTTGSPYNPTRASGDQFLAFGVGISSTQSSTSRTLGSVASTSSSTGISSPVSTSTAPAVSDSGGISARASAGIGVGVGLGVILIAIGGWFLYRRGTKKGTLGRNRETNSTVAHMHELTGEQQPKLELAGHGPAHIPKYASELQGRYYGHELDATHGRTELE